MQSVLLQTVLELVTAMMRWSRYRSDGLYITGTLWYGMMCRTFVLLEQILRLILSEMSQFTSERAVEARSRHADRKPLSAMTFGQCLGVLREIAPQASHKIGSELLSLNDLAAWERIVFVRNRLAHHGPGFLDSVDLAAGRVWRSQPVCEPFERQAAEIWNLGTRLCRSPLVMACITLQGVEETEASEQLRKAEELILNSGERTDVREAHRSFWRAAPDMINLFHQQSSKNQDSPPE
jgi:hypothetical protein